MVVVSAISLSPTLSQTPSRSHTVPEVLIAPELLFDFWKLLFFSPQGLRQRPGAAGGLQVLGLVGAITAFLLVRIDVDAVQASEEQQQRQDHNDWRVKIARPQLIHHTIRKYVLQILKSHRFCSALLLVSYILYHNSQIIKLCHL